MIAMYLTAILLLGPGSPPAAQGQVDNAQYTSWARAGMGASLTMRSVTLMGDDPRPVTSTMTYTLTKFTPDQAVVEMVTETDAAGDKVKNPPQEIIIRRPFYLLPGVKKEDLGRPTDVLAKGEETIELAGKKYKAQWYETRGKTESGLATTRSWMSDEVPGLLLRSVTKVPKVNGTITLEMIELKRPNQ
jgi:hypothetical protein